MPAGAGCRRVARRCAETRRLGVPAGTPHIPAAAIRPAAGRRPAFDWESLIGVKLFAAIAGDRAGRRRGVLPAATRSIRAGCSRRSASRSACSSRIALLVLCELKAAREYPATANALDGAAIAILFATFFAAHALWNLIPATATFALLAIVTALAVLLSIRRESLFIAVLGLLGGFATPALLSTGENRPIPLFAYLLLLNIGLAWVAYRQGWPVLTWLTLGLTTLYQLVWVARFLDESSLSLAMGIFLVFPLAAAAGLTRGRAARRRPAAAARASFERTAMLSAGVPLVFAAYLASVPAYGAHAGAAARIPAAGRRRAAGDRHRPPAAAAARGRRAGDAARAGGVAGDLLRAGRGLAAGAARHGRRSSRSTSRAPPLARWFGRPFEGSARAHQRWPRRCCCSCFPVLAAIEPAFVQPAAAVRRRCWRCSC